MNVPRPAGESQVLIGQFQKNIFQTVKAHIIPWYKGGYVDLTIYERADAGDIEHPTLSGLRIDAALLPQLIGLLEQVREHLKGGAVIVADDQGKDDARA